MVSIRPFQAIRPNSFDVEKVASLPYDVVTDEEVRKLTENNPKSYLNIDRTDVQFNQEVPKDSDEIYQVAKENLAHFLNQGWLIKEEKPAYYIYRLMQGDRIQYGIVATIAVDDYLTGKIKRHEFTRPDKELDRIKHNDASDANTSPIFLTMRNHEVFADVSKQVRDEQLPIYTFDSYNDTNHCVWRITDPEMIEAITKAFSNDIDALYIADGHHRMESAAKVAQMRREEYPDAPDDAEFNYFLGVIFPENELTILPYNRIVEGKLSDTDKKIIAESFVVEKLKEEVYTPEKRGTFGMYVDDEWYKLTIKSDKVPADPVASLDAALLQNYVLAPVFGIENPRTDKRIDFVGGIHPITELMARTGEDKVAFSLYPTTIEQLLTVADSGEVMPPKSTWFEPKLLSGLFVHQFESEKYVKSNVE
ncbi:MULTISPECIES: DUF1015 domain-containing protein [unclassified Jeotgalibaca]|uniref:DUF1015 domain-containing protein n=1 Tax=unclassified Jeotgalibaca TaxID=2621505 RepID=UPI003FD33612